MAWRDRLEKASFKGVRFYVDGHAMEKGRRVSIRRLPGATKIDSIQQDLGRNPNEISIEAFLWGDDYDADRDELEEKLCEEGPGALVLPTRGELWARVASGPVTTESKDQGGYCRIRFSVVIEDRQAGSLRKRSTGTAAKVKTSAAYVRTYAQDDFSNSFGVAGMPAKYIRSTLSAVSVVTSTLRKAQRAVDSTVNATDVVTSQLFEIDTTINSLMSTPSALASKFVSVVDGTFAIFDTITGNIDRLTGLPTVLASPFDRAGAVRNTLRAARSLMALGADSPSVASTDLGQREYDNTRAVYRINRADALARQAETYAVATFDSSTLALQVLDAVGPEFDDVAAFGASDDLVQALYDLRAALAEHLTETAAQLTRVAVYKPAQEIPALLIAHDLYADATREGEIVARNLCRYPLFVSAPIEVVAPDDGGIQFSYGASDAPAPSNT